VGAESAERATAQGVDKKDLHFRWTIDSAIDRGGVFARPAGPERPV
jgi:hypothetical protein